jgi:glyoxylate/hydroxypyruvate reductase A
MSRPKIAFLADRPRWDLWREPLSRAMHEAGIDARLQFGADVPSEVDYILYAPVGQQIDFTTFARAKAVFSLWAGVESIVTDPTLTQPLCRMVDPSLAAGMAEYVLGHVMRHHLGTDSHVLGQDGVWRGREFPPLASARTIGILGVGELGTACASALSPLGFNLLGWSRRPRSIAGIRCLDGREGLKQVLETADIVVTLLPLTAATENLLGAEEFALMRPGSVIINPGRGGLIDDAALLEALDMNRPGHATLDVFRTEPLPPDHPFWRHPKITVTSHIAAATRPATAACIVAENIRRGEAGEPFLNLVDRGEGY